MARAKAQARWRARTDRKRIEVYLPVDVIEQLDSLARASGHSRAGCIASLITTAATAPSSPASPAAADPAAVTVLVPATPEKAPESQSEPQRLATGGYRYRRPDRKDPAERGQDWIAQFAGGLRVGLRRRPSHAYHRWHGRILDYSGLIPRDADSGTREQVMATIISLYLHEQPGR